MKPTRIVHGAFLTDSIRRDGKPDQDILNQEWSVFSNPDGRAEVLGPGKVLGPELWISSDGRVEVIPRIRSYAVTGQGRPASRDLQKAAQELESRIENNDPALVGEILLDLKARKSENVKQLLAQLKHLEASSAHDPFKIARLIAAAVRDLARLTQSPPTKKAVRDELKKRCADFRKLTDSTLSKHLNGTGWAWLPDNRGRIKTRVFNN